MAVEIVGPIDPSNAPVLAYLAYKVLLDHDPRIGDLEEQCDDDTSGAG